MTKAKISFLLYFVMILTDKIWKPKTKIYFLLYFVMILTDKIWKPVVRRLLQYR